MLVGSSCQILLWAVPTSSNVRVILAEVKCFVKMLRERRLWSRYVHDVVMHGADEALSVLPSEQKGKEKETRGPQ